MKITLYTDSDIFAGTERHILDLAVGLRAQSSDVVIACPAMSPLALAVKSQNLKHRPIEKRGMIDVRAIRVLVKCLRSGDCQLIHAHNGRTAMNAALALRLAGCGKLIVTQHFLAPSHTTREGIKGWSSRRCHRVINSSVDHFIAISQAVRYQMLARKDVEEDRMTVVRNGISTPDYGSLCSPNDVRRALGVPKGAPLVVSAARLQPEKDPQTLVKAIKLVRNQGQDVHCVIAGRGELREQLDQQIRGLNLERHVQLLGFREDVMSIIAAGDIFVLPSLAEPFGMVLLEAMSLAKPVVATLAGGPMEIVEHGVNGFLVKSSSPEEQAEKIMTLIGEPDLRERMGRAGSQRFREHFTAQRMANETLAVYKGVEVVDEPSIAA